MKAKKELIIKLDKKKSCESMEEKMNLAEFNQKLSDDSQSEIALLDEQSTPEQQQVAPEVDKDPEVTPDPQESVEDAEKEKVKEKDEKPLSAVEKMQKRINQLTAEKKSTEETLAEEINELKKQISGLQQPQPKPSEKITPDDVRAEIRKVRQQIRNGETEDGDGRDLQDLEDQLNDLYIETKIQAEKDNYLKEVNKTSTDQQQLQLEVANLESKIMDITGIKDKTQLAKHPIALYANALYQKDPKKYPPGQYGSWTGAVNDAIMLCVKDGLFNSGTEQLKDQLNKEKRKSQLGRPSASPSLGSESFEDDFESNNSFLEERIKKSKLSRGGV